MGNICVLDPWGLTLELRKRTMVLLLAVACLAVLAGVMAVSAFASGTDNYATDHLFSEDGVPAVSQARHTSFDKNSMSTIPYESFEPRAAGLQVFYYSSSLNQKWCFGTATAHFVQSPAGCGTNGNLVDARCHLFQDDNPGGMVADCSAHYSGA